MMQHSSVRYRLLHGRPDLRESRMFGFKMFGRYILIIKYWTVFCVLFTGMRYVYYILYVICVFYNKIRNTGQNIRWNMNMIHPGLLET